MEIPDEYPDVRFFSLEEANRTLPYVRRVVQDIVEEYRQVEPLLTWLKALPAEARDGARAKEVKAEVAARAESLDALVQELHRIGCQFKGFREGLVDWLSLYAGRPVLLCWKLGEEEIEHWHQLDAGFIGRQRIPPSQREAFRSALAGGAGPG